MRLHPFGRFDNAARSYEHIRAVPLAAAMGAEIRGVQIAGLGEEQFADIEDALYRHKMIYFRDQEMSHSDQEAFSARFGDFAEDAYTRGVEGHVNVQPVVKEADTRAAMVFGSGWHTDSPFLPKPPAITMLFAADVPPFGGDTIWANCALAYALLSDTMKTMIAPLKVRMSMRDVLASAHRVVVADDTPLGRLAATRDAPSLPDDVVEKVAGSAHPLVRTHPVTGEKALYCDATYAVGIEGLAEHEARPLLGMLLEHMTQPALTCRLRWERNTLVLWDNRLCIHQAFNDYDGHRREMYRTTIRGEAPA
jgi:alpha-ketoglutarate-dependent taurine dioxygenase